MHGGLERDIDIDDMKTQVPHSRILMLGGGGGLSDFFVSEIWPKVIFLGLWKMPGFFWVVKKTEGLFWVAKKGLRDFLGYAKKSSVFFG